MMMLAYIYVYWKFCLILYAIWIAWDLFKLFYTLIEEWDEQRTCRKVRKIMRKKNYE